MNSKVSEFAGIQKEVLEKYYKAAIRNGVLGLYIFTDMTLDDIQDFVTEFIHYELRHREIRQHHKEIMEAQRDE